MNPDLQKLQSQISTLTKRLDQLTNYSTIPYNIENAFRQRLNNARVFMGIVAPATTPSKIGDIYVNTVLAKVYIATGLSSSSDWSVLN